MKPMLFSTQDVRAIQEGRKTQTRRVIKPQPPRFAEIKMFGEKPTPFYCADRLMVEVKMSYQPGDIIWVRETWAPCATIDSWLDNENKYIYKADFQDPQKVSWKWRSPVSMPKEAARIFLLVKNVTPEKLQDITEEDAVAEGVIQWICDEHKSGSYLDNAMRGAACAKPVRAFALLWDHINAKRVYPWESNPRVWKYVLERTGKP